MIDFCEVAGKAVEKGYVTRQVKFPRKMTKMTVTAHTSIGTQLSHFPLMLHSLKFKKLAIDRIHLLPAINPICFHAALKLHLK